MIFETFTLSLSPNSATRWNGEVGFNFLVPKNRTISTTLSLASATSKAYDYFTIDLYIDQITIANGSSLSLSGYPSNVRPLTKPRLPTVIAPNASIITDDSIPDEISFVQAETLSSALDGLVSGTGWRVKIGATDISEYPVVTEACPAITLNGSLIDQLSGLLQKFNPADLYGQGLSWYMNFWSQEIFIMAPRDNDLNTISIDLSQLRPTEVSIDITPITLHRQIWIQESEGSAFRSPEHVAGYEIKELPYSYQTTTAFQEGDEDYVSIATAISGYKKSIGDIVLSENDATQITQTKQVSIEVSTGMGNDSSSWQTEISGSYTFGETTLLENSTKYTYLTGPPYNSNTNTWYMENEASNNILFTKSMSGSRQQLTRDGGSKLIDENHYPKRLYTSDGLRLVKKVAFTSEKKGQQASFKAGGIQYGFPSFTPDVGLPTTTETTEVFTYDENGVLVGDRIRQVTEEGEQMYTVVETYRKLTPISSELTSEIKYEYTYEYDGGLSEEFLTSQSVTNVSTQVVAAESKGPEATSAMSSIENFDGTLRTELLSEVTLDNDGMDAFGNLFITTDTLTIEEMEAYFKKYYILHPYALYAMSFSTEFADPRGIIGGAMQISGIDSMNINECFEINDDGSLNFQQQQLFEISDAMQQEPFRVSGITMNWSNESVPNMQITLCQHA